MTLWSKVRVRLPSSRRGPRAALLAWGLGVALLMGAPGCGSDTTFHGDGTNGSLVSGFVERFNLGENIFVVVRVQMVASTSTTPGQLAALDARKDDIILAINTIVNAEAVEQLGPTLAALLRLIDDGTLPALTDDVASLIDSILNEPNQKTLNAIASLANVRTGLRGEDAVELLAGIVDEPVLEAGLGALADVITANDGVDDQGNPNGEPDLIGDTLRLLSRALRDVSQRPSSGSNFDSLVAEVLVAAPPRGSANFGPPAWIAVADTHGNPQVRLNAATGRLFDPFVDRNGDGAADVNVDGEPIDGQGQVIVLPAFDLPGVPGFDGFGRPIDSSGELCYQYQDAKETLLSHLLQLVAEALQRGAHQDAALLLEIALTPRVTHDNGTPADPSDDYQAIAEDNPIIDLVHGLFESWRHPDVPAIQRAISTISTQEPALAEAVLVEVGRLLERARPAVTGGSSAPSTPQSRQLTDDLLVILDQAFQTKSQTQTSSARVVVDVLVQLGRQARDLPKEIAMMARYHKLVVDPATGQPSAGSILVDRSLPPMGPGFDNRSTLQQLLDLLTHADQCTIAALFGGSLTETFIKLMAGRSVGTVSSLIDLLQGFRGLITLICPQIGPDLDGLEALRSSGALDAFLPIAKVFVDRGDTRLLVELLKVLQRDYETTIAPSEEGFADLFSTNVGDSIFDLLELMVTGRGGAPITDPLTGERAADLFVNGFGELLFHPVGGVPARLGRRVPSKVHLL
ncbi:MAG: hypothetical protein ACYS22_11245, partial [Planctomycetota bacterium]